MIDRRFKPYPCDDMMREPFAHHLAGSGTARVEPAWKAILSDKGILPRLRERHPGHPNLLPAYPSDDPRAASLAHGVRKPFFSHEGETIAIIEDGCGTQATGGDYADRRSIVQALTALFQAKGQFAVPGTWIVADTAAGLGMRQDRSRMPRDLSRFVPHVPVDRSCRIGRGRPQRIPAQILDSERQQNYAIRCIMEYSAS